MKWLLVGIVALLVGCVSREPEVRKKTNSLELKVRALLAELLHRIIRRLAGSATSRRPG